MAHAGPTWDVAIAPLPKNALAEAGEKRKKTLGKRRQNAKARKGIQIFRYLLP